MRIFFPCSVRAGFKAAVYPEILCRTFADFRLKQGIEITHDRFAATPRHRDRSKQMSETANMVLGSSLIAGWAWQGSFSRLFQRFHCFNNPIRATGTDVFLS